MAVSDVMKLATCARQRIEAGEGCSCGRMGLGAGLGWTITVRCGEQALEWIQPPRDAGDGVGFDRDFNCEKLLTRLPDLLEDLDNARADEKNSANCYDWVGSFFNDGAGTPLDRLPDMTDAAWIPKYFQLVRPAEKFQAGDVVLFKGAGAGITPGSLHVSHVGIATGFGDEVSQLWYTREIQAAMIKRGDFKPSVEETSRLPARPNFYVVTRDSLDSLIKQFTVNGTQHTFSPFEVWRVKDQSFASFDELTGCPAVP